MPEEIRGETWDLDGEKLHGFQAAQRLYKAGFEDTRLLVEAVATMYGESGFYLKAWHHNVVRDAEGNIALDGAGRMTIRSTDLGFIQKNVVHPTPYVVPPVEGQLIADKLFVENPDLARGDLSASIAFSLYERRGFQPWYAHQYWTRHRATAVQAVADYLGVSFGLGRDYFVVNKK